MSFSVKRIFLKTIGKLIPSDIFAHWFPVSVKGVCYIEDQIILLQNERNRWDLPGGKLKYNEDIRACLRREIAEELSINIEVGPLLHTTQVKIMGWVSVLIIIYQCKSLDSTSKLQLSSESFGLSLRNPKDISENELPQAYLTAIHSSINY
jgi:8-oxo-dGTP pyrophosphatase MutT (NUDIX family)